jgi:prepilin-type processing-associated H-X9-DG protein
MDYAALRPIPARWQLTGLQANTAFADPDGNGITGGCVNSSLWTTGDGFRPAPLSAVQQNSPYNQYLGVIVRGSYFREGTEEWYTNFTPPVSFARITDGASHTSVVTEKRVNPDFYSTGTEPPDDRGWSDGWDFDTIRVAACLPYTDTASIRIDESYWLTTGSAHTAGINTGFADGSVQYINYEIESEVFNRMAHRSDGEQVSQ